MPDGLGVTLTDNQKANENDCFVKVSGNDGRDLTTLFGDDHGLEHHATKPRYKLNPDAFARPDAYIGIYETRRGAGA